jgi:hypothetical protein
MKPIGTFNSKRWGKVTVLRSTYGSPQGPVAVVLQHEDGEPLATLSVNMYKPECSEDSRDLPPNCFYAKDWSENEEIAREALASGLFRIPENLPPARSGFVVAEAWEIV